MTGVKMLAEGVRQMKEKRKNWVAVLLLAVLVVSCLVQYNNYIQHQIYYESTENLLETYEQVDKTILMFAQRNWNVLSDWGRSLQQMADPDEGARTWRDFGEEKRTWNYSDFYMVNEDGAYWTVDGRSGTADHVEKAFEVLYEKNRPVVSSYTATSGVRKVVFAVPTDPIELDGVTYTGLAVSYDNDVLEDMISGGAYNGKSDCYIIYPNGDVMMSTEPKTEIPEHIDNLFDFLRENTSYQEKYFDQMLKNLPQNVKGSISYEYQGREFYLTYQPSGLEDTIIIGIVDRNSVDSGMQNVQSVTILMLSVLAVSIIVFVVLDIIAKAERKLQEEEAEKERLAHEKELADRLFDGVSRIADRFAVCDFQNDEYEYHEQKGKPFYPERGSYYDLLRMMNQQYLVLTDGEDAKITQVLTPEQIQSHLRQKDDMMRVEYCTRDKSMYLNMYIIPVVWEDGRATQVMFISQDMGRQHELENLANTDGLTGLFNSRYFSRVLQLKEERQQRFTLFYLDLDKFKPINDTYGHDVGDKLLKEVAVRLQGCVRTSDYAFRIGGDEFALIVNETLEEQAREERVELIRKTILTPFKIDGQQLCVGTSCGCASYPEEAAHTEDIRILADQRMYEDKEKNHAGR